MRARIGLIVCVLAMSGSLPADRARAAQGYQHFIVGNPADVVTPTERLAVLHGGGTDIDDIFVRMGAAAGGGDFVVLRASGTDAYNPYIHELCGCDSVETIIFGNRQAAFDPFVISRVRNAEAVWLAGGDQSNYVTYWKGTPIEDAINAVAARAPIGGTSAGTAVLGEFVYSALSASSLTSDEGLADPFHRDLTLTRDFLDVPKMGGLITDQHLEERDRMGRTVAFLARLVHDGWTSEGRAIAIDRETALIVDPAVRHAQVISTRNHRTPFVYFLRTPGPPEVCAPKTPLTFRDITVYRVGPGATFDLDGWSGTGGLAYTLSAEAGVLLSSRGDIY
jgi:cyanophycinase-like exopeptidase